MTFLERLRARIRFRMMAPLRLNRFNSYNLSCSQFGEDMIVRYLLQDVRKGFYVDIGAHHPVFISNTYHFYRRGWQGINVDAMPGSMEVFRVLRARDINLEACVDLTADQSRAFILFDSPALNTLSEEEAQQSVRAGLGKIIGRQSVRTTTLDAVLDAHVPPGTDISFLTIDIEGLDELILRNHDFGRYRPRVLVFERKDINLLSCGNDSLIAHLADQGYRLVATTGVSVIMQAT